jgi:hypothetical protein
MSWLGSDWHLSVVYSMIEGGLTPSNSCMQGFSQAKSCSSAFGQGWVALDGCRGYLELWLERVG